MKLIMIVTESKTKTKIESTELPLEIQEVI